MEIEKERREAEEEAREKKVKERGSMENVSFYSFLFFTSISLNNRFDRSI